MSAVRHAPASETAAVVGVGLLAVVAYVGVLMYAMSNMSYDTWGALVVFPVLLLLTLPLARRVARIEADPRMVRLILLALVAKLIASFVRYYVAFDVYDGAADAANYVTTGKELAESFRQGDFFADGGTGSTGTIFLRRVAAAVFALIGPTEFGAFLVFSWMGFWGLYFFYRAFRIGVPDGDHRRYALLVFFLPSLLFWPSSVGKEAWMLLTLGVSAYGAARILMRMPSGYPIALVGVFAAALVREHMAALICASLFAAYVMRPGGRMSAFSPVTRIVGSVVLLGVLFVAVEQAGERFGVEGGVGGAVEAIDDTAERTAHGESSFEASRPETPLEVPWAAFTVLFRPLPHEAHNTQSLLSSLEGVALMALFVWSIPRLRRLPAMAWRHPYVLFAVVYALLFVLAFSGFGNFGILARQRSQLFPLVLVAMALPYVRAAPTVRRARNYATGFGTGQGR